MAASACTHRATHAAAAADRECEQYTTGVLEKLQRKLPELAAPQPRSSKRARAMVGFGRFKLMLNGKDTTNERGLHMAACVLSEKHMIFSEFDID